MRANAYTKTLANVGFGAVALWALFWPGHGDFDAFVESAKERKALPPAEEVLSADFVPEGCAEDPTCTASALLAVAQASGDPILEAGPFFLPGVATTGSEAWHASEAIATFSQADPPEFAPNSDAGAALDSQWTSAVFVLDKRVRYETDGDLVYIGDAAFMEGAEYVGAIQYGENGEELFDALDGKRLEFNPKAEWYVNGPVAERFAREVRAAYRRLAHRPEIARERAYEMLGIDSAESAPSTTHAN